MKPCEICEMQPAIYWAGKFENEDDFSGEPTAQLILCSPCIQLHLKIAAEKGELQLWDWETWAEYEKYLQKEVFDL